MMTLETMEQAIAENPGKSFVLAFPPRAGWNLTTGAFNEFVLGLGGNVLYVIPPLVYFDVSTKLAKSWLHHVRRAERSVARHV